MAQLEAGVEAASVRLMGITATGGYGKSALASRLYDEVTGHQKIWINFSQPYAFALIGRWLLEEQLNVKVNDGISDDQLVIELTNRLATGRYLLVLDNVENLLDPGTRKWQDPAYQQFLLRWMKAPGAGIVVLTSREQPELPTSSLNSSKWLPLKGLAVPAGISLLRALDMQGSDADLEAFVDLADGHPLLLGLSAGFLKAEEGDRPDIAALKTGGYDLLQILGEHRDDPEASIAKVLEESLGRLAEPRQRLLESLSVYRGAFGLAAAQAMSEEAVSQADVRKLVKRSLLQERRASDAWIFQFQPLIQQFLQQRANNLEGAHQQAIQYYLSQCQPLLPSTSPQGAAAPYLEAFHHGCELQLYTEAWQFLRRQTDETDRYSSVSMFLKFRGTGAERLSELDLYRHFLTGLSALDTQTKRLRADTRKAVGDVQQFLDQRDEALANYESALTIYREVGARLGEANTLKALGFASQNSNNLRESISFFQQALEIYRTVGDRYSQGMTLQAMAPIYQQLGQVKDSFTAGYQANELLQEIDLPLEAMPYPNWLKRVVRFAQKGKFQLLLCCVLGFLAFPLMLVVLIVLLIFRLVRAPFRR